MSKRKKLKRSFPARYSATTVSTSRIDSTKAAAYNLQRSKATVGPRNNSEPKLDGNFMHPVPQTLGLTPFESEFRSGETGNLLNKHQQRSWQRSERGKTVDQRHQLIAVQQQRRLGNYLVFFRVWESTFRQGIDEYHSKVLKANGDFVIRVYFCGNEALLVMEDCGQRFISKVYQGLSVAMAHYNNNNISWAKREMKK